MIRWILVRHGESEANLARSLSGWGDVHLTERGRRQAAGAGRALADEAIDAVISSDLRRASETASLAISAWSAATGRPAPPLRLDPRLRERQLGDLQGCSIDDLRRDGRITCLLGWSTCPPGGESLDALSRRALPALADAERDRGDARCVAVFAHGGVIRALVGLLRGEPREEIGRRRVENAEPVRLALADGAWGDLLRTLDNA